MPPSPLYTLAEYGRRNTKIIRLAKMCIRDRTNTVRLDVNTLQAMEQIPPEFGLQYGWFTTESTGKSRWILTDHLKCVVSGYERLTDMSGYKVYRLIEPYEE